MLNFKEIKNFWDMNQNRIVELLDVLKEETLDLPQSSEKSRTIKYTLLRMCNARYWKIEKYDKILLRELTIIKSEDKQNLIMFKNYFTMTAKLVDEILEKKTENQENLKDSDEIFQLLFSLAQREHAEVSWIYLTLKQANFKLPEKLQHNYGNWDEKSLEFLPEEKWF